MAKQIHLKIANPCHQRWDEMTPTEQGAFCQACQTNVIDFTNKTENEIYEVVSNTSGHGCGRFYASQLESPITKSEINNSFFNWKAIAASIATLIASDRLSAENNNKTTVVYETPVISMDTASTPTVINSLEKDTELITIRGVVYEERKREKLNRASILVSDTEYKTESDSNGAFTITFPKALLQEKKLIVYASWYMQKTISLKNINPKKPIEIIFDAKDKMMVLGRF